MKFQREIAMSRAAMIGKAPHVHGLCRLRGPDGGQRFVCDGVDLAGPGFLDQLGPMAGRYGAPGLHVGDGLGGDFEQGGDGLGAAKGLQNFRNIHHVLDHYTNRVRSST